jgi:hypothetical protein
MRDLRNNYGKEIPDYVGRILKDAFFQTDKQSDFDKKYRRML